jgi:hypothetical protein
MPGWVHSRSAAVAAAGSTRRGTWNRSDACGRARRYDAPVVVSAETSASPGAPGRPAPPLHARRRAPAWLAAIALVLLAVGALCVTQLVGEVTSTPAVSGHHDFLAFHAAAQLVEQGNATGHLYDPVSISALERQVIAAPVGAAGYMPFINPPFAAALQAPLALASEPSARIVWLLLSAPLAALCCWLATAGLRRRSRVVATACLLGTFPIFQVLVEGQWSFVMLAGCLGALLLARRHHPAAAGMSLAVLALKPPLLIPVLVVLLLTRSWRALAGTVGAVMVVGLATLPFTGLSTQLDYAGYLVAVVGSHLDGAGAAGAAVWHGGIASMEGLNGLVAGYIGQQNALAVDVLTGAGVAAVLGRWAWVAVRRTRLSLETPRGRWLLVAGIVGALLTDLHLFPQDCVLLLAALPLVLEATRPAARLAVVLGVAALLDVSWLDQLAFAPHLFTWLLVVAFVLAVLQAAGAGALMPRRPATATVSALPAR